MASTIGDMILAVVTLGRSRRRRGKPAQATPSTAWDGDRVEPSIAPPGVVPRQVQSQGPRLGARAKRTGASHPLLASRRKRAPVSRVS